jgi:hypothetical protein
MSMKRIAAALLLVTAGGAQAQERPVPIARWEATIAPAEARRIRELRIYARCLVQHRNVRAEAYLETRPGSAEAQAEQPRLTGQGNCLWRNAVFHYDYIALGAVRSYDYELRGLLAEFVYHRGAMRRALRERQPWEASYVAFRAAQGGDEAYAVSMARWIALCVARADPDGVRALLDSEAASPRELQRLLALTAPIMRCGAGGPPLRVGRFGMRAVLAEALYRLRG